MILLRMATIDYVSMSALCNFRGTNNMTNLCLSVIVCKRLVPWLSVQPLQTGSAEGELYLWVGGVAVTMLAGIPLYK